MIETVTMCIGTGCMLRDDCAFHNEMLRYKVTDPGQPLYIDASECLARRNNLYIKGTRVFSRRTFSPEHRAKLSEASKKPVIARHISGDTERFNSLNEASEYCGVSINSISNILMGNSQTTRNGWTFEYDKTAAWRKQKGGRS